MCKLQPLASSFNGTISRCQECGEITILYGTFQLSLNAESFASFYTMIEGIHNDYALIPITKKHSAHIRYQSGIHLVLQRSNVCELMTLLQRSRRALMTKRTADESIAMQLNTWRNN